MIYITYGVGDLKIRMFYPKLNRHITKYENKVCLFVGRVDGNTPSLRDSEVTASKQAVFINAQRFPPPALAPALRCQLLLKFSRFIFYLKGTLISVKSIAYWNGSTGSVSAGFSVVCNFSGNGYEKGKVSFFSLFSYCYYYIKY